MKMPGLSAEASLYKTIGHDRVVGAPNDLVGGWGILPQLQRDDWTTYRGPHPTRAMTRNLIMIRRYTSEYARI
jgi:hypothetical protein